jgi:leucyl aminopeptidase
VERLNATLSGELVKLAADARFTGRVGATLVVPTLGQTPARRLVLVGIGPEGKITDEGLTKAFGAAARAARDAGAASIAVAISDSAPGVDPIVLMEAAAIGANLGLYRFDDYRGTAAPDSTRKQDVSLRPTARGRCVGPKPLPAPSLWLEIWATSRHRP